jgi:ABC-type uncharacterized transport system permease subunit
VTPWLPPPDPDRIESLKGAMITGATAGLVAALVFWGRRLTALGFTAAIQSLGLGSAAFWLGVAIAALCGGLFGITYRYAVRQDHNPQISLGVIMAFSLVRGLALVNIAAALSLGGWPFLAGIGESLALFATAGLVLEGAFRWGWVERVRRE